MSDVKRITAPFDKDVVKTLKAGDNVLISGYIIAARDAAHKALTEALARGEKLPLDFKNQVIYYVGPTPAIPGNAIGSAGPTTSGRMDKYTPTMLDLGVSGMIGKGYRSDAVVESMKKNCVVYMVAIGGTGALISQSIKKYEVLAYPELGPEAVARLEVVDFPAIVAIDCDGNDFYKQGQAPFKQI
ncbi:L-cystine import ATP-binding protein TcyC [Campylobacter sputorum subsp. bubulus]|uniref:L-cystine import ATP-binding protein TcyC n=1 Tax=Campylobacter sputorum subsp. sputorum TaxID=32024 RepID=A0A381DGR8_9BACT|nr:Fe-S-containing hydro-lyase [Campylobacter sputorum]ASM34964.1 tartrate dehydratase/fumarate hydratase, beta subunit [Campylobacter sputorum aubsp. sputorum RM3237]ASM36624.1 tartrate dehydratase/fumarate hydratase, beta subunit [Campylobacter sputorum bv. faecalis CCUG 20703]KAB0581908.1 Fe-S-containing hydro-lyase [Campylobacter sputorum subsp. sputorum]QEL05155.1 tartrate dehydratase/fumarate hydratase, beta subunit [Campylobacter sputorum subsp. sputorum]SUX09519.1 L-cystine import ATP-